MTNSWLLLFAAFLVGFIICWLLVSVLGMGHRAIQVLRDRYKNLDESFSELERSFQSKDEVARSERRALLDKINEKNESIKQLTSDKDNLIIEAHNADQRHQHDVSELNELIGDQHNEGEQMRVEISGLEANVAKLTEEIEMAKSRGDVAQSSDSEMKMLQHSMTRLREMMEEEGTAYRAQIATLQQRLEEALSNKPRKDELTVINGIGPKIESILNDNKIFSFADVVNASEDQLDKVREELGGLADRIERDDWVGQAKELMQE